LSKSAVGRGNPIALALGAAKAHRENIYAIDPHAVQPEEGYLEDTRSAFVANIRRASVDGQVIPMIMTSKEAARDWRQPIRLLWIDGDHRYESVKEDFQLWEPFLVDGGIIALHDTIRKKGPEASPLGECFSLLPFSRHCNRR
jgi:hypothetical protein